MKIEINDNSIIYNGQKFVPEKAEFKVPAWYKFHNSGINETVMISSR